MQWSPLKYRDKLIHTRPSLFMQLPVYGVAAGALAIVTVVELALFNIFQDMPFFLFWPLVILLGWVGGIGPGLFASVLAVILVDYFLLPPLYSFAGSIGEILLLLGFATTTVFMSWLRERERQSAMLAYRQREEMQITLASIGDGVIVTDDRGIVTYINPVAQSLTGWPETEAVGRSISDIFKVVNEDTRQPAEIPTDRVLQQGVVAGLKNHTVLVSRTGEERPIDDSGAPIRDASNQIVGAVLVFRDISEQRSARQALESSEEQYRTLVENATDIIYLLDADGNFLSINKAVETITGYSREELLRMPIANLMNEAGQQRMQQMRQRKLEQPETQTTYELEIMTKSGHQRTLEVNSRLARQGNTVIGIQGVARDITERKYAQQLSHSLQRLASEVAGALTAQQVAQVVTHSILATMEGSFGAVFRLSDDQQMLHRLDTRGIDAQFVQSSTIRLEESYPLTDCVRTQQSIVLPSLADFIQQYPHLETVARNLHLQGIICLPIWGEHSVAGGMYIAFTQPKKLDAEEHNFLFVMAQLCGQALERVRLYEAEHIARQEAEHTAERIARLQAITAALAGALTPEQVIRIIVEQGFEVLGGSGGGMALLTEDGTTVETFAYPLLDSEISQRFQNVPLDASLPMTDAIRTGQPVWIETIEEYEQRYPHVVDRLKSVTQTQALACVPLVIQGRTIGGIGVRFYQAQTFTANDQVFMMALAHQCAQALERAQLAEQAKAAVAAQERQRLARELHDSVNQALFSATTMAETVPRLWQTDPDRAAEYLRQVITLNRAAMAEMRTLLLELRPEAVLNTPLNDLVRQLIEAIQARRTLDTELVIEGQASLPPDTHLALYRIVQESINNILKHSQATLCRVELRQNAEEVQLRIKDNGQGFDTAQKYAGLGLVSIRERAATINADLEINSVKGEGTETVVVWKSTA